MSLDWTRSALLVATLPFLVLGVAGRAPGTPGDIAARAYVENRLKCLGVSPGGDASTYFQKFTDSDDTDSANVVGMIPGSDPAVASQVVIVSAHLDHLGGARLGANDNASGIVSVLSIAQALRQRGTAPRRTVAFMVFDSEELGCDGSHHYVDNGLAALPTAKVVYDVNFDMVGTYQQNGNTWPRTER